VVSHRVIEHVVVVVKMCSSFSTIFPRNSVNIISANTNAGKTHFALEVIKNWKFYNPTPLTRVVVVLCNSSVDGNVYKLKDVDFPIDIYSIGEFEVDEHLSEGCFLIFEDVQVVTDTILRCINIYAHHCNLASLFLICQSLLGSSDLFRLISLSHRVILFFSSSAGCRVCKYISTSFFQDAELKARLAEIISFAEKNKHILLLEVNQLNGSNKSNFLAVSGLLT